MRASQIALLDIVKTIEGTGSFVYTGVRKLIHPGLCIEGLGEIALPIIPLQIKSIIELAKKAPFGKGLETITDTTVRSAWEIDASQMSFRNEAWEGYLKKILNKTKKGLGLKSKSIEASLYKLLIYEKDDFFLPHKDSEKEKGMFGTLVIALPSTHEGGELIVRFEGKEETVDFSLAASNYRMPYAAFYADCEHEIKRIRSGYRVCLVYNLIQTKGNSKITSPTLGDKANKMTSLFEELKDTTTDTPKAILLGHQYTPANFSLENLKNHDLPRAIALINTATAAGYFVRLGLVTCYVMGSLETDYDPYSYYKDEKEDLSGTMGELYETSIAVKHWGEDHLPSLGEMEIDKSDIWTNIELMEGDPIEKEAEGYTGNAGMTLEHWYHYGALVFWPKDGHFEALQARPISIRLDWLTYYLNHIKVDKKNEDYAQTLMLGFSKYELEENRIEGIDFNPVAKGLVQLQEKIVADAYLQLLVNVFENIDIKHWMMLLPSLSVDQALSVFKTVSTKDDCDIFYHLIGVLKTIHQSDTTPLKELLIQAILQLPDYLATIDFFKAEKYSYYSFDKRKHSRTEKISFIIESILEFSVLEAVTADWIDGIMQQLTRSLKRDYVNNILHPILLKKQAPSRKLEAPLYLTCEKDLIARTAVKPTPPTDWRREVPKSKYYGDVWEMLRSFLESPTEQIFDYRKNQSYRDTVLSAINNNAIDLTAITIKKSRPYTLRIKKTQAAYELKLKKWQKDVELLNQLQSLKIC